MEGDKKYLLEWEVRGEINKIIVEELTVSDEVLKCSELIERRIIDNIAKQPEKTMGDGYAIRQMSFSEVIFGDLKVNFGVENHNFLNRSYYNEYKKRHDTNMTCTSVYRRLGKKPFVMVNVYYISVGFEPLPKFYEDLHHELNHIWQQHSEGSQYPDSEKYVHVSSDIFSDDEARKDAARILYHANPTEQDSFVSSIYAYVKHNFMDSPSYDKTIDELLKDTEAYRNICEFKELFTKIMGNKPAYRDVVLNKHKFKRWDRFEKRMRNALHRYEQKFAMCTKKCKKDFLVFESNTWCEAKDYNNYYKLF